jgi:O-antigen/teichoic acid export membrane protein
MNKLRADGKSLFYTVITIIKILVFLALVFITVVHLELAVTGILYSYLISEIAILIIQLPFMVTEMSAKFDKEILKQAIKFGFPLVFSTIGIMILNLSDRYMIKLFLNFEAVGLYDFGYRIAGVIYMFLILPFNQAFLPAAYKVYNQPGDKRYYTKAMTYMCFITVWGGLALSLFSGWVILLLGNRNYLASELFIPLIILAYIFSGKRNIASTGLLLAGKTSYIAYITMGAAVINIALNLWLIPIYGVIAAAYTTLFSFVVFFFVTKILADKFFPIPYEGMKILRLFILGIALYLLASLLPFENIIITFVLKMILVFSFPFILVPLNFYEKNELEILTKTLKNPFTIKKIVINILKNED